MSDFPFRRLPDKPEFTRKPKERKAEAERVAAKHTTSEDYNSLRAKLGLGKRDKDYKVKNTLSRLRHKNHRTWKAVGITEEDFERFGIEIGHR